MGILERIKQLKRQGQAPDPFLAQLIAVETLADPISSGYPHAVYTLTEVKGKEVYAFSALIAIESILEKLLEKPTALRSFIDSQLLLRRSMKRRGERAILELFKGQGRIQVPVMLKPVQRILEGREGDEL